MGLNQDEHPQLWGAELLVDFGGGLDHERDECSGAR